MQNWNHEHIKTILAEVREHAVRMVFEYEADNYPQWAAIGAIAPNIGFTPETLRSWVRRQTELDTERRDVTGHRKLTLFGQNY
ncbi:transposase [Aidingimonas halophila]|uniref:Transposase n=1 Tax=Aidingimonas halophila TaxID=574349 RepID=A0A1H2U1F1_9GAMM|nr:hypothetical protein GCM10008094_35400 [Aidingimonas halophila]SDW50052.1 transposase [Aidingimonas halophila]